MTEEMATEYRYSGSEPAHTHSYLWGAAEGELRRLARVDEKHIFDLGCGNGAFARHLKQKGYAVTGVDPSRDGIEIARTLDPVSDLHVGSAYENLAAKFGRFPVVISLEVVEHVYAPRDYVRCIRDLLEPQGRVIISTPYHGYFKNLAIALSGKMDSHFTALWDHGHIKFWSIQTLTTLFAEQGLQREKVLRLGRVPLLAKSMMLVFRKIDV